MHMVSFPVCLCFVTLLHDSPDQLLLSDLSSKKKRKVTHSIVLFVSINNG